MNYTDLQKKIVIAAGLFSLGTLGIALIFTENKAPFVYGLAFGTAISVLMFLQTANAMAKSMEMSPNGAQKYISSRYAIRMLIYGVVLFISLRADHINPLGTILGFMSVKAAVLYLTIFKKI